MKIFKSIRFGCCRALGSWKGIIIIWFFSLMLVALVALPMKAAMNSGLGSSMITEKLADGFDSGVFSDLGAVATSLVQYLSSGFLLLILLTLMVNAFLTGGLFSTLHKPDDKFKASEFFRASARYFWSFLVITFIISVIIITLFLFVVVIPVSLIRQSDTLPETATFNVGMIVSLVFILLMLIMFLVADYARAWQVARDKQACFKALGFGFSRTFSKFLSSFPLMLLIAAVQVLFVWLTIRVIGRWRPDTGGGVFLLFIISQMLFIVRLMLKAWRYGSVTVLKEENDPATQLAEAMNVNI